MSDTSLLTLHEDILDAYDTAFPDDGYALTSAQALIQSRFDYFIGQVCWIVNKRTELAISGAMRWPWSQEAMITEDHTLRFV